MAKGRRLKFPAQQDYKAGAPAILCPAKRVIRLYNQDSGDSAKRIAKKVRTWFHKEAHRRGWAGVYFLPEVQSNHGAGCVLSLPPTQVNVSITVTRGTLVLQETASED